MPSRASVGSSSIDARRSDDARYVMAVRRPRLQRQEGAAAGSTAPGGGGGGGGGQRVQRAASVVGSGGRGAQTSRSPRGLLQVSNAGAVTERQWGSFKGRGWEGEAEAEAEEEEEEEEEVLLQRVDFQLPKGSVGADTYSHYVSSLTFSSHWCSSSSSSSSSSNSSSRLSNISRHILALRLEPDLFVAHGSCRCT